MVGLCASLAHGRIARQSTLKTGLTRRQEFAETNYILFVNGLRM